MNNIKVILHDKITSIKNIDYSKYSRYSYLKDIANKEENTKKLKLMLIDFIIALEQVNISALDKLYKLNNFLYNKNIELFPNCILRKVNIKVINTTNEVVNSNNSYIEIEYEIERIENGLLETNDCVNSLNNVIYLGEYNYSKYVDSECIYHIDKENKEYIIIPARTDKILLENIASIDILDRLLLLGIIDFDKFKTLVQMENVK